MLLVVVLVVSVYSAFEIGVLSEQLRDVRNQNYFQGSQISILEGEVALLQSKVNALLHPVQTVSSFDMGYPCVSVTPDCAYGFVFYLLVSNNGTSSIPAGQGAFIFINDTTRSTYFGFNSSFPNRVAPGHEAIFNLTAWPAFSDAQAKLSPGDSVIVGLNALGRTEKTEGTVLSCVATTQTFTNYTVSTQTVTTKECF